VLTASAGRGSIPSVPPRGAAFGDGLLFLIPVLREGEVDWSPVLRAGVVDWSASPKINRVPLPGDVMHPMCRRS
jgi:hypothetical protein